MKILADQEGLGAVSKLVDIALRQGGMSNLDAANKILGSLGPIEEKEETDEQGS